MSKVPPGGEIVLECGYDIGEGMNRFAPRASAIGGMDPAHDRVILAEAIKPRLMHALELPHGESNGKRRTRVHHAEASQGFSAPHAAPGPQRSAIRATGCEPCTYLTTQ